MKKILLFIPFLLIGCTNTDSLMDVNDTTESAAPSEESFTSEEVASDYGEAFENAIEMQLYLYEDQTTVKFEGDGNEYASYFVETTWLSEEYVRIVHDNGGAILSRYYHVTENGIFLIKQIEGELESMTVAQLTNLPDISTYLAPPLITGTTFEGWTIEATDARYETPYETFNDVLIVTKEEAEFTQRNYFVAGIGQIASEFETKNDDGTVSVISSKLSSISSK